MYSKTSLRAWARISNTWFRYELLLERREEALGNGVVPAVALAAHALVHAVAPQASPKDLAGVLAAAVAVEDETCSGPSQAYSSIQRVADERGRHASARLQPTTVREYRSRITARY